MFISRRGKRWYNPTALNKSKGTPTCIKFETDYFQYIRSMAIRIWLHFVILVSAFALHCFSAAFIMIMRWTWWWNFDLLLPLDTWWKQTRVDLPAAGRTQNTNSWKKRALRRRDSVKLRIYKFKVDSGGRTNVFGFCLRISSSLSQIFMLSINVNDLVVELWRKDSNWRLVARKPMEIMVGVQYAKIESKDG